MKPKQHITLTVMVFTFVLGISWFSNLGAQDRFPKPEFETEYEMPQATTPEPRSHSLDILDVAILIITLGLAHIFALKTRSRRAIRGLMIFSLIYFGFLRGGCICSVGSIQNMAAALGNPSYGLPIIVVAFFTIPLISTLFSGRTFCAAVCPLGALQDFINWKPKRIPSWLSQILGIIPYVYLGLAVLLAFTGAAFIICRYDPFVSIFRFSGNFGLILITAIFLVLSVFFARPYCRFFCPYSVLLKWMSRLSRQHLTITPDECIQCRLCEDVCPVDSINKPTPEKVPETREKGIKRLGILILILPFTIMLGGWTVSRLDGLLSQIHPTVRLARQIQMEDSGKTLETTLESRTFRATGTTPQELYEKAAVIQIQSRKGGWFLGGFLGLILTLQLIGLSIRRTRADYEPDKGNCISCGRCFEYCPIEQDRLKEKRTNK
jgi:polyferredoxin